MLKNSRRKNYVIFLFTFLFVASIPTLTQACEIDFEILKNEKAIYDTSEVFVAKVNVILTHRSCPIALKKTKFKTEGLKIVGATDWKQISTMKWERKLKVKVTGSDDGKVFINAVRTCDKDGGFGSLKVKSRPLKSEENK